MKKDEIFNSLDKLEFIFNSGKGSMFGYRFINSKRFQKTLEETKELLEKEIAEAREIVKYKNNILEEAKLEADRLLRETEDYISGLNVVTEAENRARAIIEEAQKRAMEKEIEAEETMKSLIDYGEEMKNKMLEQTYEFIKQNIGQALEGVEASRKELVKSYEEMLNILNKSEQKKKQKVS